MQSAIERSSTLGSRTTIVELRAVEWWNHTHKKVRFKNGKKRFSSFSSELKECINSIVNSWMKFSLMKFVLSTLRSNHQNRIRLKKWIKTDSRQLAHRWRSACSREPLKFESFIVGHVTPEHLLWFKRDQ